MLRNQNRALLSLFLAAVLAVAYSRRCHAQTASESTRVLLDRSTFRSEDYAALQALADRVAVQVDALIPGQGSGRAGVPIFCYQVHEDDVAAEKEIGAPVTISAGFRYAHEPAAVIPGQTRIALFGIDPLRGARFAYQLAHELAHVKMGSHADNFLIETFATAVAIEVTRGAGFADYAANETRTSVNALPTPIQASFAQQDRPTLRRYWQSMSTFEGNAIDDRPFQMLGAVLILQGRVPWPALLGIAEAGSEACSQPGSAKGFRICAPDIDQMQRVRPSLDALGYPPIPLTPIDSPAQMREGPEQKGSSSERPAR